MDRAEKHWIEQEDKVLQQLYPAHKKTELLEALPGRTWRGISARARRIGINRMPPKNVDHGRISGSYITNLRCGARERGLSHSLLDGSIESFRYLNEIITDYCPFSGRPLTFRKHSRDFSSTASLDRIDSSLGYERGNVRWIHKTVNRMKSDGSDIWFMSLIRDIVSTTSKTP